MTRFPRPAAHVRPVSAEMLRVLYGRRWAITFDCRHFVWYAEQRTATGVHVLAAHEPAELAISIERAEREDGARWVTANSGPDYRAAGCQSCGQDAPSGNLLCGACEQQAGRDALTVLRSLAAERDVTP